LTLYQQWSKYLVRDGKKGDETLAAAVHAPVWQVEEAQLEEQLKRQQEQEQEQRRQEQRQLQDASAAEGGAGAVGDSMPKSMPLAVAIPGGTKSQQDNQENESDVRASSAPSPEAILGQSSPMQLEHMSDDQLHVGFKQKVLV
jgi:hypothetical protein